jgi:hypothetical protein
MAYVGKDLKVKVVELLKAAFPGTAKARGFKYSLAVNNHSTLVLTISEGSVDFIGNYLENVKKNDYRYDNVEVGPIDHLQANTHHMDKHFSGQALDILTKIKDILNTDNWDESDIMTDYFNVGHYISINIGKWDKPYRFLA